MKQDISEFHSDVLSNETSVHITGTEPQAECELWFDKRKLRVTGTQFLKFTNAHPFQVFGFMWEKPVDLSNNEACIWGRLHEKDAIQVIEEYYQMPVTSCGLFVSRAHPNLACSPENVYHYIVPLHTIGRNA